MTEHLSREAIRRELGLLGGLEPKNLAATAHVEFDSMFWLLIIILVLALIAWRCGWFKGGKLSNMLQYSLSGNRNLVFSSKS